MVAESLRAVGSTHKLPAGRASRPPERRGARGGVSRGEIACGTRPASRQRTAEHPGQVALVREPGLERDVGDGPLGVQEQPPGLVHAELSQVVRRRGVEVPAEARTRRVGSTSTSRESASSVHPRARPARRHSSARSSHPGAPSRAPARDAGHGGEQLQRQPSERSAEWASGVLSSAASRAASPPSPRWCSVAGSESSERYSGPSRAALGLELHHHTSVSAGRRRSSVVAPAGVTSTVSPRWRVEAWRSSSPSHPPAAPRRRWRWRGRGARGGARGEPGPGHDQPTRLQRDRAPVVRERARVGTEGHRSSSCSDAAGRLRHSSVRPRECIPSKRGGRAP
jgi:hypothetical protein